jgi:acyl homoserine lactone synthase
MIRFVYGDQLSEFPVLAESMFRDRADQFRRRLNWDVTVDDRGWEVDQYDGLNPLYVIWEEKGGQHGGSMRTLPTLGRTMTNDHFRHVTHGVSIQSPFIWECTRFCLSPTATQSVAGGLLMAGCEMGLRFGLEQAVGVFDARMPRIYGRIGWSPDVIGTTGEGRDAISVGLWAISEDARAEISRRTGIAVADVQRWFDRSFDVNYTSEERLLAAA